MGDRMADDLGLLMDLLGHEVAVIALLGEQASGGAALHAPLDFCAGGVANVGARAGRDDPVALLEIGDAVGKRRERQSVRAEIGLALAVADRKRRALSRPDQEIVLALEQIDEGEGAAHALERRVNPVGRRLPLRELVLDHEGGDLRIRLRREDVALGGELLAQRLEILDDAVVDDGEPGRGVRMGVVLGRLAVGRPAGVADADRTRERRGGELRLEVLQLSLGAPARELAVFERGDAGRVVAAVFQALQRLHDGACDRPRPENADNSTHPKVPCLN